jgi:hypothetical protein
MNIVKENINFERGQNPLDSMNIGRVRERRMRKMQKVLEDFADEVKADKNQIYDQSHLIENKNYIKFRIKIGGTYYGIAYSPDTGHYLVGWEQSTAHDVENLDTLEECLPWLKKFYNVRNVKVSESQNFERGQDTKISMDIGRKPLIMKWIKEMQQYNFITNPVLTSALKIDAEDVDMSDTLFNEFPPYIKFGEIHMDFKCFIMSPNALRGFPYYVGR